MTDKNIIDMPPTFNPISAAADKVVKGLSIRTAEAMEREAQELEGQAALKRFAAEQIRKGAGQ